MTKYLMNRLKEMREGPFVDPRAALVGKKDPLVEAEENAQALADADQGIIRYAPPRRSSRPLPFRSGSSRGCRRAASVK